MAKFNSNHSSRSRSKGGFYIIRLLVYGIVLILLLWKLLQFFKNYHATPFGEPEGSTQTQKPLVPPSEWNDTVDITPNLPNVNGNNQLISHKYYTLSYSENHEEAEWVAYSLTRDQLNAPKQNRFDYFAQDLSIRTRSALHRDYTGSGYTRGHLAPAADMSFDPTAAEECFYMSNISPQEKYFNQGIWRELEECVRDWSRKNMKLYIVTGPILSTGIVKKIGNSRVSVPSLFYKVLLDLEGPEMKGIGFIVPNASSDQPLENYMTTIDSVENLSGINFFNAVSKNKLIESLEQKVDKSLWKVDQNRYRRRVEDWNKRE